VERDAANFQYVSHELRGDEQIVKSAFTASRRVGVSWGWKDVELINGDAFCACSDECKELYQGWKRKLAEEVEEQRRRDAEKSSDEDGWHGNY
jgi:hypothetical protein